MNIKTQIHPAVIYDSTHFMSCTHFISCHTVWVRERGVGRRGEGERGSDRGREEERAIFCRMSRLRAVNIQEEKAMVDILRVHHQHPTWTGGRLNFILCARMGRLGHSSMRLKLWGPWHGWVHVHSTPSLRAPSTPRIDLPLDNSCSLSLKASGTAAYLRTRPCTVPRP